MPKCLICKNENFPFMSFGKMPIANGFLCKEHYNNEYFFEMEVAFCNKCKMFQLVNQPEREKMFNKNYAFYSGTSKLMAIHFEKFAKDVLMNYVSNDNPFIVEVGSNDGIMLRHFAIAGIRHLGIEPSHNVAQVAMEQGINTIVEFFDSEIANKIVADLGHADALLGANVMCHIPYLHSVIEGIKILLKEDGVIIFEEPYLGDVIEKTTYDQIYDEHVFLFSVSSIKYLFAQHGMEVIDVKPQETHGGSMRYIIAHKGTKPVSDNVEKQVGIEKKLGLIVPETYMKFRKNCEKFRSDLMNLLGKIKNEGKSIVGYAATSKSTTIINYCGITNKHLDYICDTTPIKQGKNSPGAHIPIRPYEEFRTNYPDYALLFAYNHEREIMAKEQEFINGGGKWITYVPEVKII